MTKFPILAIALTIGFLLPPAHAQTYTVLHTFSTNQRPSWTSTLSQSPGGYLLFSASDYDNAADTGLAFEVGTQGWFHLLYTFSGTDAQFPQSGLVLGTDQRFHGTTLGGGKYRSGTVFRLSPDGKIVVEHNFAGGNDSDWPETPPIQSVSGDWFGVTTGLGNGTGFRSGSVYSISSGGNYTLLHSFTGPDGDRPYGTMVEDSEGVFYGTTIEGGADDQGTIFTISADGTFKTVHDFDKTHGGNPSGPLLKASDGNFYGVTVEGGSANAGVVYRMAPDGTFTVLHNFSGGQGGVQPRSGLLEATDGNFYGTASLGGAYGEGILYRLTRAGEFTKLRDFSPPTGDFPTGPLLQHTDGRIYGYTYSGGRHGTGVIYKYDLGFAPFVTYLPIYGQVGVKVTILGQDFQNNSIVSFNGTQAQQVEIHPTYIKAIVPDGATTGPITVQTSKNGQPLTLKSNKPFVIH